MCSDAISMLPDLEPELSEIRANEFTAPLSTLRMHRRGRLANQITVCIERSEKALFVSPKMRRYPFKRADGDKEGIFHRGVISPKTHGLPGSIITPAVVWKLQGHGYPSAWICEMVNHNPACLRSVHDDRLTPILHERGVQLGLTDGDTLNLSLRSVDRRRLKQRRHSPIGQT
jgi:hypothetical protein